MLVVAAVAALAAVVWGASVVDRVSIVIGAAAFVVVAYVFGYEFWNSHVGPLPLTLDRVVLGGLIAAFAVQWKLGRLSLRRLVGCDWLLVGLVAFLATSAFIAGPPEVVGAASPWGRWLTSFAIPALLYAVVRQSPMSRREWTGVLVCFTVLGGYLAITALLEVSGQWSLVFPRYISNPNLGIHFGRARGPGLNAASLGMYLTACGGCAWLLLRQCTRRYQQLGLLALIGLIVAAVFVTYTRSTWMGLAAAGFVIAAFEIPREWRLPSLVGIGLVSLLAVVVSWDHIVGLKREGTAAESEHSVDQRESFTYVSWQMFKAYPVLGVGFGRFYDRKLSYLSDRSQPFELESIRGLHHHNTFLGFLTETGLVGLAAYAFLLGAWGRRAWQLATAAAANSTPALRATGMLMLALLANYLCSAVFHDLTLVPAQHWLLFVFAAVTVSLHQQFLGQPSAGAFRTNENGIAQGDSNDLSAVKLFGMNITRVTMKGTISQVLGWCAAPREAACRYVVTPNVDHAVMFQHRDDLRAAYADAALTLADGAPIILASRLVGWLRRGPALAERVAGSDLVPQLLTAAGSGGRKPLRVFLLGAAPGVANVAAGQIEKQFAGVQVVGTYSPPLGFENDDAENRRILRTIAEAGVDLLVIGFGAPKQELWVHRHQHELQAKVALCAGATIDFLAGEKQRAPEWMQRCGLEWAHRVLTEPRRLARRYAHDAWVFPRLLWREVVNA